MVDYFSVEYKTFIIVAESLKFLPKVDLGLSYIEIYIVLKRFFHKQVINVDYIRQS